MRAREAKERPLIPKGLSLITLQDPLRERVCAICGEYAVEFWRGDGGIEWKHFTKDQALWQACYLPA